MTSSKYTASTSSLDILSQEIDKISSFTVDAIGYFMNNHPDNFERSVIEERDFESDVYTASENVARIIANILHIGRNPTRNSVIFQPLFFASQNEKPFIFELFCRAMGLLSRTRFEMKAVTYQDYEKVMRVLEKQLDMVLKEKPTSYESMMDKMLDFNYDYVIKQWQIGKQQETDRILEKNVAVQVPRIKFTEANKNLVFKQRMEYIKAGTVFPKMNEKKLTGENFKARLSSDASKLIIHDMCSMDDEPKFYPISNISHIVVGKACPQVANNIAKNPQHAFSVIINSLDYINFIAPDRLKACYWIDALNLLTGKGFRTEAYYDELQELVKMDLLIQLLELEDVKIPDKPPAVPEKEPKPPLPPKPKKVLQQYQ